MKERVSVIIPTHDRCTQLIEAIESVLDQTHAAHELIVIDDGSNDQSADVVRFRYPSVRLCRQSHRGVSAARNRGIALASGDWLAFLDSDDLWFPSKLERQLEALAVAPGVGVCHCDEHWVRHGRRVNPRRRHAKSGGRLFERSTELCLISPSAVILHNSVIERHGVFDETLPACEDYDLWLRITASEPVLFVRDALLEKRGGHPDQLSRRYPAMDRYRLQALSSALTNLELDASQREAALAAFRSKFDVWSQGALKRGRQQEVYEFARQHETLLGGAS